ncbi:hypothetical protein B0A62_13965 [Flavobacterium hydatis]|jgi:hypothetical protein|uniref:Uncharacterized protein n=1 Tax=Flavobacterium hydatis TaxID=991 RepID=A0A086A007_FLAHY|nr:hypothetical protein IW20_21310 [Flavobacterium hydatis]OXA93345.1 hypothetical protein B0A62_13965 [Flavobacterium hydatis]
MKNIKFISVIFLFLLSLSGSTEFYKYSSELSNFNAQEHILDTVSSTLSMSNDLDVHFIIKKIKNRVANSESSALAKNYYTQLVHFKVLKDNVIYSILSIYENQSHTHLHLYQLF